MHLAARGILRSSAHVHLVALQQDALLQRPIQRCGRITAIPVLAGLHHNYADMIFGREGDEPRDRVTSLTKGTTGTKRVLLV